MSVAGIPAVELALAQMHAAIRETYSGDCLQRAKTLAELLKAAGHSPLVIKLTRVVQDGERRWHAPLIPLFYRGRGGPTWTSHFVCVLNDTVYDPLIGVPAPLEGYSTRVFGEEFPMSPGAEA